MKFGYGLFFFHILLFLESFNLKKYIDNLWKLFQVSNWRKKIRINKCLISTLNFSNLNLFSFLIIVLNRRATICFTKTTNHIDQSSISKSIWMEQSIDWNKFWNKFTLSSKILNKLFPILYLTYKHFSKDEYPTINKLYYIELFAKMRKLSSATTYIIFLILIA